MHTLKTHCLCDANLNNFNYDLLLELVFMLSDISFNLMRQYIEETTLNKTHI
jgi:hypothetical protein